MTADLEYGAEALREVLETYAQIAKSVIDTDPRDTETLSSINGYLDGILRHWTPEHEGPGSWELDYFERQPDADPRRLNELRRRVAENQERIQTKDELVIWRAVQRFGLLWWIQRQLRHTGDAAYVEAWGSFIGYFGNLNEAARAADRAVQADFEDRGRWMHWVPTSPHAGATSGPAIDLEFLQTLVLIALTYAAPDGPPIQLEPLEWLAGRLTEIEATVQAVAENEALRPLLPDDRLEHRIDVVIAAFESMIRAREQQEEERVIESPLDPQAVADFQQRVRSEWATHRLLAGGFRRAQRYELVQEPAPDDVPRWGFPRRWMPKDWLVVDRRIGGVETYSAELGRDLGQSEAKFVLEAAQAVPVHVGGEGESVAELLRGALSDLAGYGELVVLASHHWRWPPILELTLSEQRGGPAPAPPWLPSELSSQYLGSADGVAVIASTDVPDDRLLALSFDAFATWRQWRLPETHEVTVEISSFDEGQALQAVEENPDLFRSEQRTTAEARARELRKNVLLDVHERIRLEIADADAARWIDVPPGTLDPSL
jgi:hypothetical protein